MHMLYCPLCGNKLLWQSDFTFEDYGYEEDGIISIYTCQNKQTCGVDFELITKISNKINSIYYVYPYYFYNEEN